MHESSKYPSRFATKGDSPTRVTAFLDDLSSDKEGSLRIFTQARTYLPSFDRSFAAFILVTAIFLSREVNNPEQSSNCTTLAPLPRQECLQTYNLSTFWCQSHLRWVILQEDPPSLPLLLADYRLWIFDFPEKFVMLIAAFYSGLFECFVLVSYP